MNSEEILVRSKYLEMGMAINMEPQPGNKRPIDQQLSSLTREEARRAKRKFRKQWRKCMRDYHDQSLASNVFGAWNAKKVPDACKIKRRIEVHQLVVVSANSPEHK